MEHAIEHFGFALEPVKQKEGKHMFCVGTHGKHRCCLGTNGKSRANTNFALEPMEKYENTHFVWVPIENTMKT